jgi:hypothetical protein
MAKMEDEINSQKLQIKRLNANLKMVQEKSKQKLESYKNQIKLLQTGASKIINQLVQRAENTVNYNSLQVLDGIRENNKFTELKLKKFSLGLEGWSTSEWKSYLQKVFPKKKAVVKEALTIFEDTGYKIDHIVTNENLMYAYAEMCKQQEDFTHRSMVSSVTEEMESTFKTLQDSIKKSVSSR